MAANELVSVLTGATLESNRIKLWCYTMDDFEKWKKSKRKNKGTK